MKIAVRTGGLTVEVDFSRILNHETYNYVVLKTILFLKEKRLQRLVHTVQLLFTTAAQLELCNVN